MNKMLKKALLPFSLTLAFSVLFVSNDFAQAKKAPVKKTVVRKTTTTRTATAKKKTVAATKPVTDLSTAGTIRIRIITDSGTMIVRLYDSTPLHRDNFAKLVKEGFYDSLMFHRIIPGFMIQGGDPLSKNAVAGAMLGSGGDNMERIPAEFRPSLIHKKGVLAAARDGNPQKASSACQFYLVDGTIGNDAMLGSLDQRRTVKYTDQQKEIYKTIGGTPFLDMEYTVFGEVESGIEVIHKIAVAARNPTDRPLTDIRMRMELVK